MVMKKVGRLIQAHQQLCYAHGIQLAVVDVIYKMNNRTTLEPVENENVSDSESDDDDEYIEVRNREKIIIIIISVVLVSLIHT